MIESVEIEIPKGFTRFSPITPNMTLTVHIRLRPTIPFHCEDCDKPIEKLYYKTPKMEEELWIANRCGCGIRVVAVRLRALLRGEYD